MSELQAAFKAWQDTFPTDSVLGPRQHLHSKGGLYDLPKNWIGDCDCVGGSLAHYKNLKFSIASAEYITDVRSVPAPDSKVCDRERAWRKYISVRDGRDYCVADRKP